MAGSATLTIVMSMPLMNIAQQITPRPHHRRASGGPWGAGKACRKPGCSIGRVDQVARIRGRGGLALIALLFVGPVGIEPAGLLGLLAARGRLLLGRRAALLCGLRAALR